MELPKDEAEKLAARTDFIWHQRFEIGSGVFSPGVNPMDWLWNIAGVPEELTGKSVLDIGTTNGATAFMAERRGADRVVAVDILDEKHFGFRTLKEAFESEVEFIQANIYELPQILEEKFDFVFFWGVLYHLRHPILALDNLRLLTQGTLYIETAVADHELGDDANRALTRYYRLDELGNDGSNWFAPTTKCLVDWCISSGLTPVKVDSWPKEAPTRAHVVAHASEGPPEYLTISYEHPLTTSVKGPESHFPEA